MGTSCRSFQTAERSPGPTALCLRCATTSSSTPCSRHAACLFDMHSPAASTQASLEVSSSCRADFPAAAQGAGALGLIVLLVSGELKPSYVLGFCIATSNAVGLLGGLFLLGYGLIAIPKQARPIVLHESITDCRIVPQSVTPATNVTQLWFTASVKGEERALHHRAGLQHIKAVAARQCALPRSACLPV